MDSLLISIGSALWLGILTSISPCPLATNIAAISYVGRRVQKPVLALLAGLLYTCGRALVYITIALVVTKSLELIPGISLFLQRYMNLAIGPLLLLVGILLLGIIPISFGGGMNSTLQSRVDRMGIWGAGLLGVVFALAFCPVSAGIFFGALIPLAIKGNAVLISFMFAVGTSLPVVVFAIVLSFFVHLVGTMFNVLTSIEKWVRRSTAIVMMGIGFYLILRHNIGMNF